MVEVTVGQKIAFKKPGSGRGRPSMGTVQSIGAFISVTTRLGDKKQVHPSWVLGEHTGSYVRKEADAPAVVTEEVPGGEAEQAPGGEAVEAETAEA